METYKIVGIDVHKKMLAVVVTDAAAEGECRLERRKFGIEASELRALTEWLTQQGVREVVMESTAQYWKPVWGALERLLETGTPAARRGHPDVRHAAFMPG